MPGFMRRRESNPSRTSATECRCNLVLPVVYAGSRQSHKFTATVSGITGSARIAISDGEFKGTLDEVKAVTGHEIGHYVPGHVWRTVNLPDALASALVKTAEHSDPRPGRLQEILFYTHPSVERRMRRAMDWQASHPP